jgi:hypothetical protein
MRGYTRRVRPPLDSHVLQGLSFFGGVERAYAAYRIIEGVNHRIRAREHRIKRLDFGPQTFDLSRDFAIRHFGSAQKFFETPDHGIIFANKLLDSSRTYDLPGLDVGQNVAS